MKKIVESLLKKGLGAKAIARQLQTTEWQIRLIKKQLLEGEEGKVQKPFLNVATFDPTKGKKSKTYIFTSWEIRNEISDAFVDILKQIQKHYDAELYLIPVWPDDIKFIPPQLKDFKIVASDFKLNKNLFFKYVPTHALVVSPLAGWKGAFPDSSVILPGLVKEMITEPTNYLSKQLMTTGSVGRLRPDVSNYKHLEDYSEQDQREFSKRWSGIANRRLGKIYAIAQEYTLPSALIVNVIDDKTFLTRYISMHEDGIVYDLNLKFTQGKKTPEISRPSSLEMGDYHAWLGNKSAYEATKEQLKFFKPDSLSTNDWHDNLGCCYHNLEDFSIFGEAPTIEEESNHSHDKLLEISPLVKKILYKQSNHDDFTIKYLKDERNYKYNRNYATCLELRAYQIRTKKHPIIKQLRLEEIPNLEFIPDNANHKISGVYSIHGHQTVSGKRVGFKGLAQVYNRVIMGHHHSPAVFRNAACVGMTSEFDLGYNKGASGWLHCNGLIQPDGSIQLLPIINGRWKL